MKKTTVIIGLIASLHLSSEMKPLTEFLNAADIKEPTSYLYISKRCAALYATSAGLLSGEIRNEYMIHTAKLTTFSTQLDMKISGLSLLDSAAAVQEDIRKFKQIYDENSEQSYIESGLRVSPLINEDLLVCKPIADEIYELVDGWLNETSTSH